jgi:DDE superfamily endonuclease
MNDIILRELRQAVYGCFERGADALFNLADALLSESQAQSLVELSLSPFFERKWSSVYEGLEDGLIKVERLREVLVRTLLAQLEEGKPIWLALDESDIERAEAKTSEDRGYIKVSNLPLVEKALSVGWRYSNVVLLPSSPSSWTPPLDTRRIPTGQTPVQVAIEQLRDLKPLLGMGEVIVIADRGYGTPEFVQACRDLGYKVLVRVKSDRKLYRKGVRIHPRGPVPKDGPVFQGKRRETHGEPDALASILDTKGHGGEVRRYSNLHFKQKRDLSVNVICVEREGAKGSKRDPRLSWFVTLDDSIPMPEIPFRYELRFSEEHNFRFFKQDLLWTAVHVRTPAQFERWSWLVVIVMAQLYLARDLGQAMLRPWEPRDRPVTPAQVRRVMPALLSRLGTPARPCRPRGVSPGRSKGFRPEPATRFPVIRKHPKKVKTNQEPLPKSA